MFKTDVRMMLAVIALFGFSVASTASQASNTTRCQSRVIKVAATYLACATDKAARSLSADRCEVTLDKRLSKVLATWEEACPNLDEVGTNAIPFQELLAQQAQQMGDAAGLYPKPNSEKGMACARKKASQASRYLQGRARSLAARVARSKGFYSGSGERSNESLERRLEAIEASHGEACEGVGSSPSEQVALNDEILLALYESVLPVANVSPTVPEVVKQLNLAMRGGGPNGHAAPPQKVYSKDSGWGVLARNFNDGVNPRTTEQSFVVTMMLHNDINVPNLSYPASPTDIGSTNVDRKTGQWTTPTLVGVWDLSPDTPLVTNGTQWNIDPWFDSNHGTGGMKDAKDFDAKGNSLWGYAVLYPHDSNSEKRAVPVFENTKWNCSCSGPGERSCTPSGGPPSTLNYQGYYDAPLGKKPFGELQNLNDWQFHDTPDASMYGASRLSIGNPEARFCEEQASLESGSGVPSFGAGAGIHVSAARTQDPGQTSVCHFAGKCSGDASVACYGDAECSAAGKGNCTGAPQRGDCWQSFDNGITDMNTHWYGTKYDLWRQDSIMGWYGEANYAKKNASNGANDDSWGQLIDALSHGTTYWPTGTAGAPLQYLGDYLVPWVNNFKDMINIQNALWKNRKAVYGFDISPYAFQGWNEIPIAKSYQAEGAQAGLTPVAYAFMLPQGDASISKTLNSGYGAPIQSVGRQLDWYFSNHYLFPGSFVLSGWQRGPRQKGFQQQFLAESFTVQGVDKLCSNGTTVCTYTVTKGVLSIR